MGKIKKVVSGKDINNEMVKRFWGGWLKGQVPVLYEG